MTVGCNTGASGSAEKDEPLEVARLEHPKVVNSAYFSPRTGSKILTTCIDNRCVAPQRITRPTSSGTPFLHSAMSSVDCLL
jgi:hypothetical protein